MTIQQLAYRILNELYSYARDYYVYTHLVYSKTHVEGYEKRLRVLRKKLNTKQKVFANRNHRYIEKIAFADKTIEEYLEENFPSDWKKFSALVDSGLSEQQALDKLTERTSYLEPIHVSYWFWESAYYLTIANGEFLWHLNMTKEIIHKYNPAINALKEEIKALQDEIMILEKKINQGSSSVQQVAAPKVPVVPESKEQCIKLIQDLYTPSLKSVTCKVVKRRVGLGMSDEICYIEYDLYCEDGVVPVFREYSKFDKSELGVDREIHVQY